MNTARTIVITGAAGGIGAQIVERFLANGDTVIAVDLSQEALDSCRTRWDIDPGALHYCGRPRPPVTTRRSRRSHL